MPTRHARAVRNERLAQPRDAVIGAVLFGQPRLPKAPAVIAAVDASSTISNGYSAMNAGHGNPPLK
jgi:hypothetical protein